VQGFQTQGSYGPHRDGPECTAHFSHPIATLELEKEICRAEYKYTAGGRWRQQHRTEIKMEKTGTTVAYVPPTGNDKAQVK